MTGLSVPCSSDVRVTVTAEASHLCPFRTEVDHGTVAISWSTAHGETVELHALAALVRCRERVEISHEQWTADLAASIAASAKVDDLTVTSTWQTGGLNVSVHSRSSSIN